MDLNYPRRKLNNMMEWTIPLQSSGHNEIKIEVYSDRIQNKNSSSIAHFSV